MPTPLQEAQWVLRAQCDDRDALEQLLRSLFIGILFTFGFLGAHARADADGHSKLLFAATGAQMAFIGVCAVLVSLHVTRMAKTVLHAIELTRK